MTKKLFRIVFMAGLIILSMNLFAQQWSGNDNITDPIGRTGNVGVGTTSPQGRLNVYGTGFSGPPEPMLFVEHQEGFSSAFRRYKDGAANALFLLQKSRGTLGSPSIVQNGDNIGQIRMEGFDGSSFQTAGWFRVQIDGTPSSGIMPGRLIFATTDASGNVTERMHIRNDGNVGIGTDTPGSKLAVNGDITCKEVVVTLNGWADDVFEEDYDLMSLNHLEYYILKNKHLPGIPKEKQVVESGVKVGEFNASLLRKVEELTLYIIDLNKKVEHQAKQIEELKKALK